MADTNDSAFEVIKHIMAKRDLSIWPLGSWLQRKETSEDGAALASLPLMMGYPEGGQIALSLTGWNERSVWGFDPPDDAYFAQLWHNGSHRCRAGHPGHRRGEQAGQAVDEAVLKAERHVAKELDRGRATFVPHTGAPTVNSGQSRARAAARPARTSVQLTA
jgi:hypothetical protein